MNPALLLFAFTAGAAAFFAPCCVAMLPAYVAYAVRGPTVAPSARVPRRVSILAAAGGFAFFVGLVPILLISLQSFFELPYDLLRLLPSIDASLALVMVGVLALILALVLAGRTRAAMRGAAFGGLATLGFLAVFLLIGLPIAFLARSLSAYLPVLAVLVGASLVILGALMLAGKEFAPRLPTVSADPATPRGFVLFGAGYGIASLSCTFPIFLGVMAAGLLAGGAASALGVFAAYALGKATLLVAVTAVSVAGGDAARIKLGRASKHVATAAALLLIVTGGYLAYYYGRFVVLS